MVDGQLERTIESLLRHHGRDLREVHLGGRGV